MSKFKVGDRVRKYKRGDDHKVCGPLGMEGVIEDVWGVLKVRLPEGGVCDLLEEYELIGEVKSDPGVKIGMDFGFTQHWVNLAVNQSYENLARSAHKLLENKNKSMLKQITSTLKRVLSASMQKQYRADFRNGDLALTQKGKDELLEILAEKYEKELTERAGEIIKEEEKNS
jgi:hypothetical protein